jgi:biotin operon repressor
MIDILPLFKALADEKRIRIIALLSARPLSVQELAGAVDLTEATVSHHLTVLRAAGLVEASHEQYYTVYRFQSQPLIDALQTVAAAPPSESVDADLARYDQKVLATYLVNGKLSSIPTQRKKRDVVLRYLTQQFEPGRIYTEKEVNQLLVAYHDDVATLRRELVSANPRLLTRESGRYWRVDEAVVSIDCPQSQGVWK